VAGSEPLTRELFARSFEATVLASESLAARERQRLLLASADPELPPRVRATLRSDPGAEVRPGAIVRLRAALRPLPGPSVPGGYHFAFRAWFDRVGATSYALGPVELLRPASPPNGASAWLAWLRADLTADFQSSVGGKGGAVAAALVTGDRGAIPDDANKVMRDAGLAHLLSISGLDIAVVVGGTMWLVRWLLCLSPSIALRWSVKMIAAALAALAGVFYTLLAGAEVPTVRSCIAALVVLAGLTLGRQVLSLRIVAFAILLLRPETLRGPSFQLSFGAVRAIVALY
jgi:competence protein ComEC